MTVTTKPATSARDIKIKPAPAPRGLVEGLQHLAKTSGANKHDVATNVIKACISQGYRQKGTIIDLAMRAGLNGKHVAVLLQKQAGPNPAASHWRKRDDGTYALHDAADPRIKAAA